MKTKATKKEDVYRLTSRGKEIRERIENIIKTVKVSDENTRVSVEDFEILATYFGVEIQPEILQIIRRDICGISVDGRAVWANKNMQARTLDKIIPIFRNVLGLVWLCK